MSDSEGEPKKKKQKRVRSLAMVAMEEIISTMSHSDAKRVAKRGKKRMQQIEGQKWVEAVLVQAKNLALEPDAAVFKEELASVDAVFRWDKWGGSKLIYFTIGGGQRFVKRRAGCYTEFLDTNLAANIAYRFDIHHRDFSEWTLDDVTLSHEEVFVRGKRTPKGAKIPHRLVSFMLYWMSREEEIETIQKKLLEE